MPTESHIKLDRVGIDFTIYQAAARQAKKALLRTAVGGFIGRSDQTGRIVVRALQDINLGINSGDRVAFLGHNGAGKTTLLRTMAGIYAPTAGTVTATGRRVPLFELALGLDEEASGYENILMRGLLMGFRRAEIESKVDDIAAFSGLGDFLNLPIRTYSSGMVLRLLFSIATSVDAEILLMDEWLGTGDEEFIAKADQRLHKLIDRSHILIIASHNLTLLQKLCNRAVVLSGGRIIFEGSVKEAVALYSERK